MKLALADSSARYTFILDYDSTLPFVPNDILTQMDDKVGMSEMLADSSGCTCCPHAAQSLGRFQELGPGSSGLLAVQFLLQVGCTAAVALSWQALRRNCSAQTYYILQDKARPCSQVVLCVVMQTCRTCMGPCQCQQP